MTGKSTWPRSAQLTTGGCGVLALFSAIAWAVGLYPAEPQWGPLGTWVGAGVSAAAVVVAVRTSVLDRRDRKAAEKALADEKEAREVEGRARDEAAATRLRREQASLVSWWTVASTGDRTPQPTMEYLGDPETWFSLDIDGPPYPYRASMVGLRLFIMNANRVAMRSCDVGNEDLNVRKFIGFLPPGEHVFAEELQMSFEGSAWTRHQAAIATGAPIRWIEFVDTAGIVWRRHRDGTLEEVQKEPATAPSY